MKNELLNLIYILSFSTIIPLGVGIFAFRKMYRPLKVIFIYTIIATVFGATTTIMSSKAINNLFLVNIFAIIEFLLIGGAYYSIIKRPHRLYTLAFLVTFLVDFIVFITPYINGLNPYNHTLKSIVAIELSLIAIVHLIFEFKQLNEKSRNPQMIILSIGVFMYFSSTFLIVFLGSNSQLLGTMETVWIYVIHSAFYFLFMIALTLIFGLCLRK